MISTGIVRRIDDLGRVVIPKEIRIRMGIKEGDPLELCMDKDNTLCLKKYVIGIEALSAQCTEYVARMKSKISAIMYQDDVMTVITDAGKKQTVKRHPEDKFDFNIAVACALAKMGYEVDNPAVDYCK